MKLSKRLSIFAATLSLIGLVNIHSASAGSRIYFGMDYGQPTFSIGYDAFPYYRSYYRPYSDYGYRSRHYSRYGFSIFPNQYNYRRHKYGRHHQYRRHQYRRNHYGHRHYRRNRSYGHRYRERRDSK